MKILITGATGFVGRHLIPPLLEQGCSIIIVSRNANKARNALPAGVEVIDWENNSLRAALETTEVVINLAGENIATTPWSKKQKTAIMNSRILAASACTSR